MRRALRVALVVVLAAGSQTTLARADDMVVDDSGNVGVGTSTPAAKLDVDGDVKVTGDVVLHGSDRRLEFFAPGYSETYLGEIVADGDASGGNSFERAAIRFPRQGTGWNRGAGIDFYTRLHSANPLDVSEIRMRIFNDGAVEIRGDASLNEDLWLWGVDAGPATLCIGGNKRVYNCNSSSVAGKEDVAPLGDGLDVVLKLRPVSFSWKDPETRGHGRTVGLLAEDVAHDVPELALHAPDGSPSGVAYQSLSPLLVSAVQSLERRVRELEAEVHELRSEFTRPTARPVPANDRTASLGVDKLR